MLHYNLIDVKEFAAFLPKEPNTTHTDPPPNAREQFDSWDGDIQNLPTHQATKDLITEGVEEGKRSEAMMTVLCALASCNFSNQSIIEIFENYPIGEKYLEKGRSREQWLQPQIEKAHEWVNRNLLEDAIRQIDELHSAGELNHEKWSRIAFDARLSPAEIEEIILHLEKIGVGKKRVLNNEWKHRKDVLERQTQIERKNKEIKKKAGEKHLIHWDATNLNLMVEETEHGLLAVEGKWPVLNYGGCLSLVTQTQPEGAHTIDKPNEAPPQMTVMKRYDRNSLLLRIEQSNCYLKETKQGPEQIPVPSNLPSLLLDHPSSRAPEVIGQVNHPIVTSTGQYINKEGYNKHSKLYLAFGGKIFGSLDSGDQREAHDLFDAIVDGMFSEFEWEDENLDKTIAVTLFLTTLLRKLCDIAPGFLVKANVQGSGKTTLFRIIHLAVTGHDMPVTTLSEDKQELRKAMLAMLLQSMPLICFDNVPDGFEIRSSILAKVLTSPYFQDRLLGSTKQIQVPTNTVIGITGNNITLDSDLVRRFIPLGLQPKDLMPEKRQFKNPAIVPWTRSIRTDMIMKALSIIKMYNDAGSPGVIKRNTNSGFPMWDRMVRSPILWASGVDVIDAVDKARNESSDLLSKHAAIDALVDNFGYEEEFTANEVFQLIKDNKLSYYSDEEQLLRDAFMSLSPKTVRNNASTGWALKKLLNFPSERGVLKRLTASNIHKYWISRP